MLHIVFLILKIIGLIILGILGLILGTILLVLLVPIRYRVDGSYYNKLRGTVRITWLLHILSIRISYEENIDISFRIFGLRLLQRSKESDRVADEAAERVKEAGKTISNHIKEDPLVRQELDSMEDLDDESLEELVQVQEISGDNRKKSGIFHGFSHVLEKIKFLFRQVYDTLKHIKETYVNVLEFFNDEENQKTIKLILRQVKALIRHIFPGKASGSITFGFDDPYRTGQVLSAASIFYAWYGQQIVLVPMFDQVIMEGELRLKGRVRVGTLLWRGLLVYLNKNFRVLLKRWWKP